MIVIDLINDEAPLFIGAINNLIDGKSLNSKNVIGVKEGTRWDECNEEFSCVNRLHFFDELDARDVDLNAELKRIGSIYNNFNLYACDRYLINEPRSFQIKMLVYSFMFYENLFKHNVTHYYTTGIAYTYNLVSYQVATRFGIKHVSFYGTRLGNRTAITYGIKNSFDEVNSMYANFNLSKVTSEMYQPINDFLDKPQQPIYMNNAINGLGLKKIFISEFFVRFKKYYLTKKHKYDVFTRNPFELAHSRLSKMLNGRKINIFRHKIFDTIDYNDRFLIFPLHMQPEASTLVLSPFYVEQKSAIINISKILPVDVFLYVKEHKSALGQHSSIFYNDLKKYPNIKLISYREDTFDLIKRSIGTINLTSTVGLESLMMRKPSIVLGDVFYNHSGLTFKVNSYFKLQTIIVELCSKAYKPESYFINYNEKLAYFLYCLHERSYPFEFNVAKLDTKERVLQEENIIEFANCIKKLISA